MGRMWPADYRARSDAVYPANGRNTAVKQKADTRGELPLISRHFDNPCPGVFGAAMRIQNTEGTLQNLIDETNALR